MLVEVCAARGMALDQIVRESLAYFQRCQLPDGSIAEDPGTLIFQEWDSVNALKATAIWRDAVPFDDTGLVEGA
jgi:hypothetical protein